MIRFTVTAYIESRGRSYQRNHFARLLKDRWRPLCWEVHHRTRVDRIDAWMLDCPRCIGKMRELVRKNCPAELRGDSVGGLLVLSDWWDERGSTEQAFFCRVLAAIEDVPRWE